MLFGVGKYNAASSNQNTKFMVAFVEERRPASSHFVK